MTNFVRQQSRFHSSSLPYVHRCDTNCRLSDFVSVFRICIIQFLHRPVQRSIALQHVSDDVQFCTPARPAGEPCLSFPWQRKTLVDSVRPILPIPTLHLYWRPVTFKKAIASVKAKPESVLQWIGSSYAMIY